VVVLYENWTLRRVDTEGSGEAESVPAFVEEASIIVDNPWRQEQGPLNTEGLYLHVQAAWVVWLAWTTPEGAGRTSLSSFKR
jgi:hypothetical protein